tara:strand:- start:18375 stop:19211 length:837 start_codon:yes stop_codon:yes gene_type:complete
MKFLKPITIKYKTRQMSYIYFLVIISFSVTGHVFSQHGKQDKKNSVASIEAEKDWKHLSYMKSFFCEPNTCKKLDDLNLLEYLKFEDQVFTNRSKLAEAFLDKYPDSKHYDEALSMFLSIYFRPLFITDKMNPDRVAFLSKHDTKSAENIWFQAHRVLPIDKQAKDRWLKKGNDYVSAIVKSSTSVKRKARAEMWLFNRDYLLAKRWYSALSKDVSESDYWVYFDMQYWESMRLRLCRLMDTYPDSELMARYIQSIFDNLKEFSPDLSERYLQTFSEK